MLDLAEWGEYSCGSINDILSSVVRDASAPECRAVQTVGTLCGCPEEESDREPCDYCPILGFPKRTLSFLGDFEFPFSITCEMLHAYHKATVDADDQLCGILEWIFADYCGCSSVNTEWHEPCNLCGNNNNNSSLSIMNDNNTNLSQPNRTLDILGLPFDNCAQLETAVQQLFIQDAQQCTVLQQYLAQYCGCQQHQREDHCTFCPDGVSTMTMPDREIPFLSDVFSRSPLRSLSPTCALIESYVGSLAAESDECGFMQLLSSYCGCPAREDACDFCPNETPPQEYMQVQVSAFSDFFAAGDTTLVPTCEVFFIMQDQISRDDRLCYLGFSRRDLCGCNNGEFDYSFANSHTKRVLLAWLPRLSGLISALVSFTHTSEGRPKKCRLACVCVCLFEF